MRERLRTLFLLPWIVFAFLLAPLSAQTPLTSHTLGGDPNGIYYRVGGDGPPLLLVHGFGASGKQWDRFVEELSTEFTLIIPDLPGHGESTQLLDEWDYEIVSGLLFEVLDELGVEKVDAIGHSAGATTLLRMAVADLDRFNSLVIVGQTHRLPLAARAMGRAFPEFDQLPEADQRLYAGYHRNGGDQFARLLPQFRALADDFVAYDLSPEHVAQITIPAFVVMGDRDPYYPMSLVAEFFEALPNAALWVVPNQGHMPVFPELGGEEVAAEEFPSRVKAFLATAGSG
jgi:pimeloyl-ACP methyl ester carboxylesterase